MSESRANYQILPDDVRVVINDTQVEAPKRWFAPVTALSNLVITNPQIRELVEISEWDADADSIGTFFWITVYWAHLENKMNDPWAGYATQGLLAGIASNTAAIPFVYQECLAGGDTRAEAISSIMKYFLMYAFLFDGGFQFSEDSVIALGQGDYTSNFERVANPNFDQNELLWAMAIYVGGYTMVGWLLGKALKVDATFADALKAGAKNWMFYYTDKWFDVDWQSVDETPKQVLGCCAVMWGVSFTLSMGKGLLGMAWDYCVTSSQTNTGNIVVLEDENGNTLQDTHSLDYAPLRDPEQKSKDKGFFARLTQGLFGGKRKQSSQANAAEEVQVESVVYSPR